MTRSNKKKIGILVTSVALIAAIAIGMTLAYFTDTDQAQNVFTLGKVSGNLTETSTPDPDNGIKGGTKTPDGDGIEYDHITPGDKLSKVPTITLDNDSEDAYIRVKLEVVNADGKLTDAQKAQLLTSECLDFQDGWVVSDDGYVYYQTKMAKSNTTAPVFTVVSIPGTWGNSTSEATFQIKITADMIQADNFTPQTNATGQIVGWTNADGTAVTIEDAVK